MEGETGRDVCIVYPSVAFSHQICNLKAADKQHHTKCFLISSGNCIFFSGITFLQAAAYLSKPHIMSTVSFSALDLLLLF